MSIIKLSTMALPMDQSKDFMTPGKAKSRGGYVTPKKLVDPDAVREAFELLGSVEAVAVAMHIGDGKIRACLKAQGIDTRTTVPFGVPNPKQFRCQSCSRVGRSPTCEHCGEVIAPMLISAKAIEQELQNKPFHRTPSEMRQAGRLVCGE